MPDGDRKGPAGMGSMMGRGRGLCAGFASPDSVERGLEAVNRAGKVRGNGRRRMGRMNSFCQNGRRLTGAPPADFIHRRQSGWTKQQELNWLKSQSQYHEDSLKGIKKRTEVLESEFGEV